MSCLGKRAVNGRHLLQDIDAVLALFHHPAKASYLAFDLLQTPQHVCLCIVGQHGDPLYRRVSCGGCATNELSVLMVTSLVLLLVGYERMLWMSG